MVSNGILCELGQPRILYEGFVVTHGRKEVAATQAKDRQMPGTHPGLLLIISHGCWDQSDQLWHLLPMTGFSARASNSQVYLESHVYLMQGEGVGPGVGGRGGAGHIE